LVNQLQVKVKAVTEKSGKWVKDLKQLSGGCRRGVVLAEHAAALTFALPLPHMMALIVLLHRPHQRLPAGAWTRERLMCLPQSLPRLGSPLSPSHKPSAAHHPHPRVTNP
jgi:hypothetical protein